MLTLGNKEPIAVVGMGCRFPGGATDPEKYWQLLLGGVDAVSTVPKDRWDITRYFDPDLRIKGKMNTRWGGFIEGVDLFDPHFFDISPREAEYMDPQQRLLLEVAQESFDDAGLVPAGSVCGLFIGAFNSDYTYPQMTNPEILSSHSAAGNIRSIGTETYQYDQAGNLLVIENQAGDQTNYTFDWC